MYARGLAAIGKGHEVFTSWPYSIFKNGSMHTREERTGNFTARPWDHCGKKDHSNKGAPEQAAELAGMCAVAFGTGIPDMHQYNAQDHRQPMLNSPETGYRILHYFRHHSTGKIILIAFHKVKRQAQQQLNIAADEQVKRCTLISVGKFLSAIQAAHGGDER